MKRPIDASRNLCLVFAGAGCCLLPLFVGCTPPPVESTPNPARPPVAEQRPHATTVHGVTLVDDYFWMREKGNPKVIEHLKAEDAYTEAVMKPTAALQNALFREMVGHIKQTDDSVPYLENGYYYYWRTLEGLQYRIYCRKRGSLDAPEEVILDQNALAKGQPFLVVGPMGHAPGIVSDDGNLLAFTADNVGYMQYTLHVKDLRTGRLLSDEVARVDDVVWSTDSKTIFYVTEDPATKRHDRFWRHVVGTDRSDLLYEEKDERFDLQVSRSRDKAFIVLLSAARTSTEAWFMPADQPLARLRVVSPREPNHEYEVEHRGRLFYIRTNKGATNFRVVTAPTADPSQAHWRELVAHRSAVKIDAVDVFARHLVLSEWEDGLQQTEIVDLATGARRRIHYPEPTYASSLAENMEFDTSMLRYRYESLVTPPSIFDYDMNSGVSVPRKETEVPGGFDRANYASERLFAIAADGAKVPVSIVYRKGLKRDGSQPLLLYAYGSYGYSTPPTFASNRLPLLDRGVSYAIAHVRGGGELGEPWRDAGRMMNKLNTFTDFIAAAEHVVAQKYTSRDRLIIEGRSAGGLLVGAVVNMRPESFKAAIAQVPFVDVVNDMLDASLPLTTAEYLEWGNPNEKPAFEYLMSYSPYDNIRRQAYPAMLVKTSLNDSQVMYWEGTKYTAKLRVMKTDANPVLLKVNFGAGHGGASGRYDALHESAFDWAFLLSQVGISR